MPARMGTEKIAIAGVKVSLNIWERMPARLPGHRDSGAANASLGKIGNFFGGLSVADARRGIAWGREITEVAAALRLSGMGRIASLELIMNLAAVRWTRRPSSWLFYFYSAELPHFA